jgi:hypothetical protein
LNAIEHFDIVRRAESGRPEKALVPTQTRLVELGRYALEQCREEIDLRVARTDGPDAQFLAPRNDLHGK